MSNEESVLCNHDTSDLRGNNYILWTQVTVAMLTSMIHLGIGTILAFSGVTLPQLTNVNNTDLTFTENEAALFSSIINGGGMIGSLMCAPLMFNFGQRITMLMALPAAFLTWLTLGFAPTIWAATTARFFLGVFVGLMNDCCSSYIIECVHTNIRGRLISLMDFCRQSGYLFVYIIGSSNLKWRELAFICGCVTTIIPTVGLYFMHNSPRWLAIRHKFLKAEKSLRFYRGPNYDISHEFIEIRSQVNSSENSLSIYSQIRLLFKTPIVQKFLIMAFIMFTIDFNGNLTSISYTVTIFKLTESGINAYLSTIIMGLARMSGVVVYFFIGNSFGRKTVFIFCLTLGSIFISCLGFYFYCYNNKYYYPGLEWMPLVTMTLFVFSMGIVQPVLSMVRSEILPNSVRSLGVGFLVLMLYTGGFAVIQVFPIMVKYLNTSGTFWFYGFIGVFLAIMFAFTVPETKGKSLEQLGNEILKEKQSTLKQITTVEKSSIEI